VADGGALLVFWGIRSVLVLWGFLPS
jgi:hypothetical protein